MTYTDKQKLVKDILKTCLFDSKSYSKYIVILTLQIEVVIVTSVTLKFVITVIVRDVYQGRSSEQTASETTSEVSYSRNESNKR